MWRSTVLRVNRPYKNWQILVVFMVGFRLVFWETTLLTKNRSYTGFLLSAALFILHNYILACKITHLIE